MQIEDSDQPATKKDIEVMFSTFGDLVFKRFDLVDEELAKKADKVDVERLLADKANKADISRLEHKLNPTIDHVDDHEVRIKKLEPKPA